MMGNLARAGYGASIDGTWPWVVKYLQAEPAVFSDICSSPVLSSPPQRYSYEACDSGTLMNQTDSRGQPEAVQTAGRVAFNRRE